MKTGKPIEGFIHTVASQKVILDADLAFVYGVSTKALNQAVKRNESRFPADFRFQINENEWAVLRSQIVTAKHLAIDSRGGRRTPPWAFTEHGAIMAAMVLNSAEAVTMSVYVVRAFVRMREQIAANAAILRRLAEIDKTLLKHDQSLRTLWGQLEPLLQPPQEDSHRPKIGFQPPERK